MYLSDIDIEVAIGDKRLILDPGTPIGPSSIDLHLDRVEEAKVWDLAGISVQNNRFGNQPNELRIARADYREIAAQYLVPPPTARDDRDRSALVVRRDGEIVIRPFGFVLWQTKETVGTPIDNPEYICFVDGKSTRARAGLVVHLTAPTIHPGWSGRITLEMCNLGPLDIVLVEDDVVAQIVIAKMSQPPKGTMASIKSVTQGQKNVGGSS